MFASEAWLEYMDTITTRLLITQNELEDDHDVVETGKRRGACKELRFVLAIPDIIEQELKQKEKENEAQS